MRALIFLALVSPLLCQEPTHVRYGLRSVEGTRDKACPSTQEVRDSIHQDVDSLINTTVLPKLLPYLQRPCDCGGPGWSKVAYLNMSDTTQTSCPGDWELITTPKRSCGRPVSADSFTCHSAVFSIQDTEYSRVCGRIIGYQFGQPGAFWLEGNNNSQTIDGAYVDGVSLTYENPRQHIWTFSAALDNFEDVYTCPCTDINREADITIPSYVGNDYFCETGVPSGQGWEHTYYPDDPLWDGEGCGTTSACCTFNNPPWFCKHLPQPTNDDLEIRICSAYTAESENTPIELVEIYIQ